MSELIGIPIVVHPDMPPGEVAVRNEDEEVARITGIEAEPDRESDA